MNDLINTIDKQKTVLIIRTFNMPVETLWKAWSEETELKKWWGPVEYTCPYYEIDFKVGGKYLACMKAITDGKETWSTGAYKEIKPLRLLVFTNCFSDNEGNVIEASEAGVKGNWPRELVITLDFENAGGKGKLTMKHEGIPADMYDDCTRGWQSCFDKLEERVK